MGIHGLTKLLADVIPQVLKETKIENFFSRRIAIDASMFLYSFLVAIRPDSQYLLTDQTGETTSHLQGMYNRTIRLIENGIKPIYVFDGQPPELKSNELSKRKKKKEEASEELTAAIDAGNKEDVEKLAKRTVRVTPKHNEECKKLLRLMGVPVIEAPCEAEATCAALCRSGKVWATGSEDMDSLTFGTSILVRHLTFSEARKLPVLEINLDQVLAGLELTMDQFIDMCILCGCDYCGAIKGIGPKRSLELIKKYGSIEKIISNLDKNKYQLPGEYPYQEARNLFKNPLVISCDNISDAQFQLNDPDEQGLIQFLVNEKQFNIDRVNSGLAKLKKSKATATQGRLENFFTKIPSTNVNTIKPKPKKTNQTTETTLFLAAKKIKDEKTKNKKGAKKGPIKSKTNSKGRKK
eukprot:TRINITY_DN2361_c2_g1_i1.p1 TRINITY_DN2361_c2_g1~~TRINITY_DN2361_c2_g1_i1.p1  ORF type:complete len:409 (-),score=191.19 TRINITY_DN2361_c2_g1_i1:53-1279(-)